jgi:FlaA1/EpsC-like NDP-sugar epimerase
MVAGLVGAVIVLMAQLTKVPRAVLALHPVVSLMGLCMVRIAYRMLYEHMRGRMAGSGADTRRALVMGAGDAARLLLAGIHRQGWMVVGLLDDDPAKRGARVSGVLALGRDACHLARDHRDALRLSCRAAPRVGCGRRNAPARAHSTFGRGVARRPACDQRARHRAR